jgi:hypothetical protein
MLCCHLLTGKTVRRILVPFVGTTAEILRLGVVKDVMYCAVQVVGRSKWNTKDALRQELMPMLQEERCHCYWHISSAQLAVQ